MARKLKSFVTQSGFFDLAVAAPSMKAALDAWGFTQNVFHQGFAHETDDPQIVAATTAKPGLVLRRAVGTNAPFQERAELPTELPAVPQPKAPAKPKKPAQTPKVRPREEQAAILSFEAAKAARDRARAKEEKALAQEHAARQRKVQAAEERLEAARAQHERRSAALAAERDQIDRRINAEVERWKKEQGKLQSLLDAANR